VKPDLTRERSHGAADVVILLSTSCVAVGTWNYLSNISTVPPWKIYCGVGLIFVLALAGLTRRAYWAHAIRFLMGIWTVITPFIVGLPEAAPALWIYLITGVSLTALSFPGVIGGRGRDRLPHRGIRGEMSLL
jgi:hypothetical protein